MKDTSAEMEVTYRELLMRRSGEDRVRMAGRMFDSARTLALAGIAAQGGAATAAEVRAALFLRFYGRDFDDETRDRIAEKLRAVDVPQVGAPALTGGVPAARSDR